VVNLVNNTDSLYPKLTPIPYPKCGQTNPSAQIFVASASGLSTTRINTPGDARDNYIADLDYIPATGELIIQQLNRLQNTLTVMIADPYSGNISTIYTDHDDAWIDIKHALPWSKSGEFFITLSERDGWRRAYKVSKNPATEADRVVPLSPAGYDAVEMVGCDDDNQLLYYIASPHDPLRRYLYVVGYDGSGERRVTPDNGEFVGTNGYTLSKDCKFAVHTFSNVNRPTITSIIALPNHEQVLSLATNTVLAESFNAVNQAPIQFFKVPITTEDNKSVELDAWILHPPDFVAGSAAAYPVIFYVYGEPAAQIVKDQWGARLALWHRMLTQRGCVVVSIDNRGTPCPKGREWRKCIYRKVGIVASADQSSAVSHVLSSRPYLDPARVGVWGWSGGGSMSLNCLFRYPEIYKNAVVVAPVPDMQLYDTIYQERYMGLPADNADGYKNGSPITFANQMSDSANVLLIHGTGDDNCHYQGMERLINELIRNNKQFQMLAYPNRSHSISEGANTTRHLFESITRFWKSCNLIK
jgi:dipeptidyl-peptidase-4